MTYKTFFAAASLAVLASTSFAADQAPQPLTRADVVAELQRARASGETGYFSESFGYTLTPPQQQATALAKTAPQPAAATPVATNNLAPANTTK
jgi:hypothetical protein